MATAQKLVATDPCQVPALTLIVYVDRAKSAQSGDPNGKQEAADAKKYGQEGLDCLPKFVKPEGTSDADFAKMKPQMTGIFEAGIGWGALQDKDNAKAAVAPEKGSGCESGFGRKISPCCIPWLLLICGDAPDYQNGIWFAARAAAVAPPAAAPGIEKYARSQYVKFHAGDDGWAEFLAAAKAGGPQVPVKPAPTPAEQAHNMITATPPDKMDFATWEFVLATVARKIRTTVWNAIKGKAVQMNGTIISTEPTQFMIAGSSDDIDAKKADITLKFEEKVPVRMIPKDGASFDFQGEPASYTPNPFMMVMEKGQLLRAKAAPATHKCAGAQKPAAQ